MKTSKVRLHIRVSLLDDVTSSSIRSGIAIAPCEPGMHRSTGFLNLILKVVTTSAFCGTKSVSGNRSVRIRTRRS